VQGERLASAEPSPSEQQRQHTVSLARHLIRESLQFHHGEETHLLERESRLRDADGGVDRNPPIGDREIENPAKDAERLPYRRGPPSQTIKSSRRNGRRAYSCDS
jgi:hypothetical protein